MTWDYSAAEPYPYGSTETYGLAFGWLIDCEVVHDWGCGPGWFGNYYDGARQDYAGIDGTPGFAGIVTDLAGWHEPCAGLLMRHVLEHNHQWRTILANAVEAFTQRMCLVTFTPDGREENLSAGPIPDLALPHDDIRVACQPWLAADFSLKTSTQYGSEHVWLLRKD